MENLRHKKINNFIKDLNLREQKYLYRKLQNEIIQKEFSQINFTINGKAI